MELRDYQEDALQKINNAKVDGINKQVIVLATGLGKTIIFSSLASNIIQRTKKRVLVLAHREELLTQAKNKIHSIDPFLKVSIEQANNHAHEQADIVVASVPTLGRANSERIKKFNPLEFAAVIIDEAHHASSDSYKNILRYFGLLKGESESEHDWNRNCLLLGVTATPNRTDNKGLDQIFDKVTFNFGIVDGIKRNYLSSIKAFRINTATDLSNIKRTAGDFNLGELAETVNNEDRNNLIVQTYKDLANGKQALCFAADVAHTVELANLFRSHGVNASYVTGATPTEQRRKRLEDFYNKKINVMVNAMVLTEGYDNPSIEVILMARPTQSGILFQQMIGRGTRLHTGKEALKIIDFVDATSRQNLQTTAQLIGLQGNLDFKGKDILKVKDKVDELLELAPNADLEKLDIDKIKYALEEVDILSGLKIPDEIVNFTNFDWHKYSEDEFRVGLGDGRYITVNKSLTGQYEVKEIEHKQPPVEVGSFDTIEGALYNADKYITKQHPDSLKLVRSTASWRADKPSAAQLNLLRRFRVSPTVLNELTKGQASRLITKLINQERRNVKI